jgi:3',5'-cyclic AMP phosphodiesterase CpdA
MSLLLHLSDPHFGTAQARVIEALLRLAQAQQPQMLVLSGDITQRARPAEFRQARAFCDRLGQLPLLALPGNHDISLLNPLRRLFWPYAAYLREFGPALEPVLETPSACLIGVNTTRWWRHKNGEVSPQQVERVAQLLRQVGPERLRIVVVHQPVQVLRPEDAHDRLRGAEVAVRAWADAGADLLLGGHIHLPYVCELSVPFGLRRHVWAVQAGTAVSSRVRREAPNSVNLLRSDAARQPLHCRIERWDYLSAADDFVLAHISELQPDRRT